MTNTPTAATPRSALTAFVVTLGPDHIRVAGTTAAVKIRRFLWRNKFLSENYSSQLFFSTAAPAGFHGIFAQAKFAQRRSDRRTPKRGRFHATAAPKPDCACADSEERHAEPPPQLV